MLSPFAGRLSDRREPRLIASGGMALTALGLGLFFLLRPGASLWWVGGNLLLLGVGFALFSSPNMNAIMGSVEKRHYGIASGAVATMRLLGQMTSMAVATLTFALIIGRAQITPAVFPLFLKSVKICFAVFTLLCAGGIFFSLSRGRLR